VAYGVSFATEAGVVCAGGSNAREHFREVFTLSWTGNGIQTMPLPPLPRSMANGCGAVLGKTVYLAGGAETPEATNAMKNFWALDLGEVEPRWKELSPWPGPARMLAVAAVMDGAFFLVSGAELHGDANGKPARRYLKDAYRFKPGDGWKRIADLPRPAVAAPSPALAMGHAILILGGDDGSNVGFQPPNQHPGFSKTILAYTATNDSWIRFGDMPVARVTTPTSPWNGRWVIASGEVRPGVRSPEVWTVQAEAR
jgi:N-acetylneuraminic acid mutarotase